MIALMLTTLPIVYCFSIESTHQKKDIAQFIHLYYKMLDEGQQQSAGQMISANFTVFAVDGKELSPQTIPSSNHQPQTSYSIHNMDIRVVGHSAIATYELVTTVKQTIQDRPFISKSIVTAVLECTNEQWIFVHHHHTKTQ